MDPFFPPPLPIGFVAVCHRQPSRTLGESMLTFFSQPYITCIFILDVLALFFADTQGLKYAMTPKGSSPQFFSPTGATSMTAWNRGRKSMLSEENSTVPYSKSTTRAKHTRQVMYRREKDHDWSFATFFFL